jgi:hypothetical protein
MNDKPAPKTPPPPPPKPKFVSIIKEENKPKPQKRS